MTFWNYETLLYQAFKTGFTDFQNLMFFRIYATFLTANFCLNVPEVFFVLTSLEFYKPL